MTTLNVYSAATRQLDFPSVIPHECLVAAGRAILDGLPGLATSPTAIAMWDKTPAKFRHAGLGPRGVPVYIGPNDVALSLGDDKRVTGIDFPSVGRTGIQTIQQRIDQVGGPLRGWASWFDGYELESIAPPAPPKPSTMTKVDYRLIGAYLSKSEYGNTAARVNGIPGPIYWRGVQKWGRAHGFYGSGYLINGIPGARTLYVQSILLADLLR